MPINDNNPERKNLIILAASIIMFYLADGEISDSVIRLQVVNVTFHNPKALVYFIWVLLFWFTYRYWLTWQGSWKKQFCEELSKKNDYMFIIYKHLIKKFEVPPERPTLGNQKRHCFLISIYPDNDPFKAKFEYIYSDDTGKQVQSNKNMDAPLDRLYIALIWIYLFFRRPALSTYFTPYIVVISAMILAA
jgi:hypothetical protein